MEVDDGKKIGSPQYDDTFRAQAVALVIDKRMPVSAAAKQVRVSDETLKKWVHESGRTAVYRWVHLFYNRKRMHSALNDMTPVDFEEQHLRKHSDRAH